MSHQRSQARHHAVQALYQWQMAGQEIEEIEHQFIKQEGAGSFDQAYFKALLQGVLKNLESLDEMLTPCLDRAIESVDPVERAILRIGTFELSERFDVPYRVVIDEAVELAKRFGAEQGHRYVNGVLDKLAHQVRRQEADS